MRLKSKVCTILVVLLVFGGFNAFAESNGVSMTPPADYDEWSDSKFGLRDTIGYGDIATDPDAHGLSVYYTQTASHDSLWKETATPELGDHSVATVTLASLSALTLAGAIIAHKKVRSNAL